MLLQWDFILRPSSVVWCGDVIVEWATVWKHTASLYPEYTNGVISRASPWYMYFKYVCMYHWSPFTTYRHFKDSMTSKYLTGREVHCATSIIYLTIACIFSLPLAPFPSVTWPWMTVWPGPTLSSQRSCWAERPLRSGSLWMGSRETDRREPSTSYSHSRYHSIRTCICM